MKTVMVRIKRPIPGCEAGTVLRLAASARNLVIPTEVVKSFNKKRVSYYTYTIPMELVRLQTDYFEVVEEGKV